MVQGTASSVGKSLLVTALCRILLQDGHRVAPFKSQNMALNSYVTHDGCEMGRAQVVQAEAAGIEPIVAMNPILLKPEGQGRSQLIVRGRVAGHLESRTYLEQKQALWPAVVEALDRLRQEYAVVLIEGAGSPAEINLRSGDIVNMRVAHHAQAPVLLVGDVDRGGVFASLVGTLELLEPQERDLIGGLVINKFRGDLGLLQPGLDFLEKRTGKPVLGVVPYLSQLRIAEEDSVGLEQRGDGGGPLQIIVVRLPHISNFDDFDLLAAEPAVTLRYVDRAEEVDRSDLIILPGTKATADDLAFLRATGLADAVIRLARSGTPVLGICGGYQMLGTCLLDPLEIESAVREVHGLGLLPVRTTFLPDKRTRQIHARVAAGPGYFSAIEGALVRGYEIHMGMTESDGEPLFHVLEEDGTAYADGCRSGDGLIAGTYLHGIFEEPSTRAALIGWLAARRSLDLVGGTVPGREAEYDRLADAVRNSLDMGAVYRLIGLER
jgi:adenosylcobyric acid synthase